jgi:hypothetical protein
MKFHFAGIFIPIFFKRFISKKICIACSKKSSKIVFTTNLKNYVYFNKSEIEENISDISDKISLKTPLCLAVSWLQQNIFRPYIKLYIVDMEFRLAKV